MSPDIALTSTRFRRKWPIPHFIRTNIEPEWMVLCLLPVLPPKLRPIVQIDEGKLMSSDINELYRRVIYRNNTLTDLFTTSRSKPGELVMCQEKLVQEAVDTFLDNGIHRQPIKDGHQKVYKSFSDVIKGKEERFHETLLRKRVDYSGCSVIVVGPSLSLHHSGFPREIAIELFQTFVIRGLIRQHLAPSIGVTKSKIREKRSIVWEILYTGIPTYLVEGHVICLHPLVCKGFNADYDKDQMAVHIPLSLEEQADARLLIFSHMNLLSPVIGDPSSVPTQDMLNYNNALLVQVKLPSKFTMNLWRNKGVFMAKRANLVFHNKVIDGTAIKRLISRLIDHFRMAYTSHILDQVKAVGFYQATATSILLGIDDLLTIPSKGWLVQDIEQKNLILEKHYHFGNVHAVEKLHQSIEIWYATTRGNASQVHQLVGIRGLMVVDTAVRTSNVGYLMRRLVEVVQHIVVRRTNCGTTRGISMSHQKRTLSKRIFIQILIGRVLADDIYMGPRCIAIRNQYIGLGLVDRFRAFRTQPISIRTPFTCRSMSWICRLCYGRSPTHEAIGIIARQSVGEPKTQLTLRTFHTGGVFIRVKFNEDLVHPTRTRHGHPAFFIEYIIHKVTIPPKMIVEIRAGTYTLNLKERSTDVYHSPEFTYSNVHLLPKTSHLWILSKGCSDFSDKKEDRIYDYSELNRIIGNGHCDFIYSAILHENADLLAKRRRNRFIILFQLIQDQEKELMMHSYSGISMEIPINGIFHRKRAHSIIKREDEVHILFESSSIMVQNNSIIGVDTQITLNTRSQVGGLVRVERKKKD
ncbi:hypothetical protein ES288_D08G265100v1 [Gossypium darwinii]|uniref:DNA-directed RNA polymerase subunit n=1 Tax=Gossypium darwinii TaxID=34276 RepID=A0A5D2BS22_GOSDA|nr:hypothetical protein ES288_D08G265100v1 [Gossypium darwinii]